MENVTKWVSIHELITKLDRDGAAVYLRHLGCGPVATPMIACWVGEKDGWLWFHLGDVPHWGPRMADLKQEGDALVGEDAAGREFRITSIENAPELRAGEAYDFVEGERAIMTREQAIAFLGDTPAA